MSRLKQVVLPAPFGPMDAAAPHLELDAADGHEAPEGLGQALRAQDDVVGHAPCDRTTTGIGIRNATSCRASLDVGAPVFG